MRNHVVQDFIVKPHPPQPKEAGFVRYRSCVQRGLQHPSQQRKGILQDILELFKQRNVFLDTTHRLSKALNVFLVLQGLHVKMKVTLLQIFVPLERIEDLSELMVFLVSAVPKALGQRTGIYVM
jgi:hypothetical protein